eukprot:scaffold54098_cov19-Tisochrysis_lutea.AAC.1
MDVRASCSQRPSLKVKSLSLVPMVPWILGEFSHNPFKILVPAPLLLPAQIKASISEPQLRFALYEPVEFIR